MILTSILQLISLTLLYLCVDSTDSSAPTLRLLIVVGALFSVVSLLYHWERKRDRYDRNNHSD